MAQAINPYTLETVSGKFVDLLEPDPSDICINDIAWAVSRLARFNGHTVNLIPYSVAQHSIVVAKESARIAEEKLGDYLEYRRTPQAHARIILLGLLHDASEAYTGDVSGPLKKIPEFRVVIKKLEHKIQDAIYQALDLEPPTEDEELIIKEGDMIAQRIEAYNFMVSRGQNWTNMPEVTILKLQEFQMPMPSPEVYEWFLEVFNEQYAILTGSNR